MTTRPEGGGVLPNHEPDRNEEAEVNTLRNKIHRLEILLKVARRAYADLVAAARAALTAQADGEPDPWAYLRDELPPPPPGHPLAKDDGASGGRR
jgi:hypothetical protein